MEHISVSSYEEFEAEITRLDRILDERRAEEHIDPLLFRGQSDSSWTLSTTLERMIKSPEALEQYFRKVALSQNPLETFTGQKWDFDLRRALGWCEALPAGTIPGYELLVYLRHHGFPSPLLDWTESPRIAAFFAFRDTAKHVQSVSVYAYCQHVGTGVMSSSDRPSIHTYGPDVRGHLRHFLQKSNYSICTEFRGDTQYFASHEDAIQPGPNKDLAQDWMWKIDIPASERGKVLHLFSQYNLSPFSLFGSVESFAETLGLKYFGPYGLK